MNPEILEQILSCKRLPSLPAVALEVIDLTGRDDVRVQDLAETIRNDQALAAKVLRTVNSSFYGLARRCGTIDQAIVMLGLTAVKTLALGFSLVSAIDDEDSTFDFQGYWRRGLLSGMAARAIASEAGLAQVEECFLGGLLQDVGVLAMHQALGEDYDRVLALAGADHHTLVKHELEAFETQHPDIGAALCARWRLPDELVMPVKYHERPTAAPKEHLGIVQAVALGNIAADVMISSEPAGPLKRFYSRAVQWFSINEHGADEILRTITASADQMARLLDLNIGQVAGDRNVVDEARRQMLSIQAPIEKEEPPIGSLDPENFDDLTGLASRRRFNRSMIMAFEQLEAGREPLCLTLLSIDGFPIFVERHGDDAADGALVMLADRLRRVYKDSNALLARFDETRFAAFSLGEPVREAVRLADAAREAVSAHAFDLFVGSRTPRAQEFTLSVGMCCVTGQNVGAFAEVGVILAKAEEALQRARDGGADTVRLFMPKAA